MEVDDGNDKLSDFFDGDKIISLDKYRTDSDKGYERNSYSYSENSCNYGEDDFKRVPRDPNIFKRFHEAMLKIPYRYELYSEGFDMQKAISLTPDISDLAKKVITEFSETYYYYRRFYHSDTCRGMLIRIVKMNKNLGRDDALLEAAKEYVAVKYFHQCVRILRIHLSVVCEIQTMTDEEYIELRNQLIEDGE